jgi:hypothetical protein
MSLPELAFIHSTITVPLNRLAFTGRHRTGATRSATSPSE